MRSLLEQWPREAKFVESVCITITMSTLLAKAFMVADSLRYAPHGWSFWLPSLFIADLFFCSCFYLFFRAIDVSRNPESTGTKIVSSWFFLAVCQFLVQLINATKLTYYWYTGAVIDWALVFELMSDPNNWSLLNLGLALGGSLFALHVPLFVYVSRFSGQLANFKIAVPRLTRNLKALSLTLFLIYAAVQYHLHRPRDPVWQALERNDVLQIAMDFIAPVAVSRQDWDENSWYISQCKRMRDVVAAVRRGKTTCEPSPSERELELGFLREIANGEDNGAGIRNAAIIVVESLRSEMMPLNFSSSWAKQNLLSSTVDATPTVRKLANRGWLFPYTRSACSYTVKALVAIFCANYPLLVNFDKEYFMDFPFERCLPSQLRQYDWETAHFQPGDPDFDAQSLLMERFGFESIYGPPDDAENVNMFGPMDRTVIPDVMEWVRDKVDRKQQFMFSFLTNMLHGPHRMPERYRRHSFAKDSVQNEYINTLRHTDTFIAELMRELVSIDKTILNTTLFVFVGDHGVALGERGRLNNNENPAENNFLVPMLFYTENEALRRHLPQSLVSNAEVSAVDLVPSLLHLMRLSRTRDRDDESEWTFEEGNSLFSDTKSTSSRMQFSMTNPGYHSLVLREGDLKLVAYPRRMLPEIFRLSQDPLEVNALGESDLSAAEQRWFTEALQLLQMWRERNSYLYKAVYGNTKNKRLVEMGLKKLR